MNLRKAKIATTNDPNAFPTRQLLILAICRFSEPIAFNSILAYTFVMVKDLGIDEKDASLYAGLLVSAYAVAEALTSMGWGVLSDRIGRKPVVLLGLVGVALSSLIFGLAKSYWVALLARFVGGALNGNVSVMQTMVAEMVKLPEHEPKAYAVQPFVWTLGGIIGSAMGGFLAQPAVFYPSVFSEDGLFGRYPYLLPNLVSVAVVVIAVVQGLFLLEETLVKPGDEVQNGTLNYQDIPVVDDLESIDERTPLHRSQMRSSISRSSISRSQRHMSPSTSRSRPRFAESSLGMAVEHDFIDLRRSSFGTVHSILLPDDLLTPPNEEQEDQGSESGEKTFNWTVMMLIVALLIFSYHQMAASSLLATYLLDEPYDTRGHLDWTGGLGYTVHDVGVYLAVNGVLGLFIQAVIFPIFVARVGVWHSFLSMIILYPVSYMLMPFLSAFAEPWISVGIYVSLLMQSFCGLIVAPVTLILIKDATPSSRVLGRVNGLAMSGACLARTAAPPLVGVFYALAGSATAWASCVAVALIGAFQLIWVPRQSITRDDIVVDNALTKSATTESRRGRRGRNSMSSATNGY
ncbi:related to E.coli tetracycline resistance protein TCR1 [Fusarium torulosum]|uniref:Related to E.coli tetracycline resistance protein TCR1 n=1 Tax=Fusarium torulosum TaxID=33205 RepID=A0AAE8M5I0_9HYPO|nr:related to E.coli tetracycline resistance protein TCR1 [Fusarium torulosum]